MGGQPNLKLCDEHTIPSVRGVALRETTIRTVARSDDGRLPEISAAVTAQNGGKTTSAKRFRRTTFLQLTGLRVPFGSGSKMAAGFSPVAWKLA
ncbi:Hypothetical protein NTJ_09441 [Nesidiocoris tenuis]|uniref:Uncharacterized protein n=1 Tax=Nesidiocoris tenuis TaxID=355587 RepID=A0ABN7AZ76_9HEMI|nr:Hypothetical protein NTJ_09441 [Nesidiocoris tenuis]